jgi:hypothetical protein
MDSNQTKILDMNFNNISRRHQGQFLSSMLLHRSRAATDFGLPRREFVPVFPKQFPFLGWFRPILGKSRPFSAQTEEKDTSPGAKGKRELHRNKR